MPRQRKKSDLPTKTCVVCGRPFTWRKKWADCWDEVKYCSQRCRRNKGKSVTSRGEGSFALRPVIGDQRTKNK